MSLEVRELEAGEEDAVARLWHRTWHEAHGTLVPRALVELRDLGNFAQRLPALLPGTRIVGAPGAPVGLCIIAGDELNQLYVARESRGTGLAAQLIADGEARLAAAGTRRAWLVCAVGNNRAARFYAKRGWHLAGTEVHDLSATGYHEPLEVWRFEKLLGA